jgi:hypothetical protein
MKILGEYRINKYNKDQFYVNNKLTNFDEFCKDVDPETRNFRGLQEILNKAFKQKINLQELESHSSNFICYNIMGV